MRSHKSVGITSFDSVYFIPVSIFLFKLLEIILRFFNIETAAYLNPNSNWFVVNFIEWFGVLYGLIISLILVNVWRQFDTLEREFDKEADAVLALHSNAHLLHDENSSSIREIATLLRKYVVHVIDHYRAEVKGAGNERKEGDQILEKIKLQFQALISPLIMKEKDALVLELFRSLNDLVDIRGDRISLFSQQLPPGLRHLALIGSIIFVTPLYLTDFTNLSGILGGLLILGVTLFVIYLYMIIIDLDEPFSGTRRITDESWRHILEVMDANTEKPTTKS